MLMRSLYSKGSSLSYAFGVFMYISIYKYPQMYFSVFIVLCCALPCVCAQKRIDIPSSLSPFLSMQDGSSCHRNFRTYYPFCVQFRMHGWEIVLQLWYACLVMDEVRVYLLWYVCSRGPLRPICLTALRYSVSLLLHVESSALYHT